MAESPPAGEAPDAVPDATSDALSFRGRVGLSLGLQVAQLFGVALVYVLLARALGPEGKGQFAVAVLLPTLVASVLGAGLDVALIYHLGKGDLAPGRVLGGALGAYAVLASLALVVGLLWAPTWVRLLHLPVSGGLFTAMVMLVVVQLGGDWCEATLVGLQRWAPYARVAWVTIAGYVAAMAVVLLAGGGVPAAVATALTYRGLRLVGLAGTIPWRSLGPLRVDVAALAAVYRFALTSFLGRQLQHMTYRLDIFLVSGLRGAADAGLYATAAFLVEGIGYFARSLARVIAPTVAGGADLGAVVSRAARQVWWITAVLAVGLAAVAFWVVPLVYGAAFRSSVIALWLLAPGAVAVAVNRIISSGLTGSGAPHIRAVAAAIGLTLSVALDLLLIPRWGIAGAAVAATVAYVTQLGYLVHAMRARAGVAPRELFAWRAGDFRAVRELLGRRRR